MKTDTNQYGFFISLIIHFLILIIPFSILSKKDREVVEFFVSIEEAYKNPEIARVKKEVVKQIIREREIIEKVNKIVEPEKPLERVEQEKIEDISDKPVIPEKAGEEPKKDVVVSHQDVSAKLTDVDNNLKDKQAPIDTEFGSAIAPSFLHKEIPEYPLMARKLGKEGKVVLRLTIDEKGQLVNIEVIERAGYGFTESAIEAVKKSTFLPAKKNGVPVVSRAMLPVKFILRRN